jgi:chemotaxis protein methyltransferase CheR
LAELPDHVKERYFTRHGDLFTISNEIRRLLIFSRHNLVNDRWQHNPLIEPDHIISFFDMDLSFQIIDLKNKIEQAFSNVTVEK